MLIATEFEKRRMECHNYECEHQYYRGRCINLAWANECLDQIKTEPKELFDTRKENEN